MNMGEEATMVLVVPLALLAGTVLIVCAEQLGWVERDESRLARFLRRTEFIVCSLVAAEMATLWAFWAGDVNEAPFAIWGALVAAGGLVLVALKSFSRQSYRYLRLAAAFSNCSPEIDSTGRGPIEERQPTCDRVLRHRYGVPHPPTPAGPTAAGCGREESCGRR